MYRDDTVAAISAIGNMDPIVAHLAADRLARKAVAATEAVHAFKAESFQDEDGVIVGRVSVAGNFDRENERILESALKSATWELARNPGRVGVDINHETEKIDCDVVGVYYDYGAKACVVHLRPADRAIYEAARDGEIVGMSWSGPYTLVEVTQ